MAEKKRSLSEKKHNLSNSKEKTKPVERGAVIENNPENYPRTGNWGYAKPEISDKCIACGRCASLCPENIIEIKQKSGGKKKAWADLEYCKGCGLCAEVCPVKAIEMKSKR